MAREVNIYFSNWTNMHVTVPVPKYSVDVTVNWIDNAGVPHTHTETAYFPNALAGLSVDGQKELAIDICLKEARERLGVDT